MNAFLNAKWQNKSHVPAGFTDLYSAIHLKRTRNGKIQIIFIGSGGNRDLAYSGALYKYEVGSCFKNLNIVSAQN